MAGPGEEGRFDAEVIIAGTGFSGLCMAIQLQKAGMPSFLLLERGEDIGGTWRDNTYPGAACDIPSHLYSFSFELNPAWTRVYPGQEEILGYLKRVADKHGLRGKTRFGTAVLGATYDDQGKSWAVATSSGTLTCRALVLATGALSEPEVPPLPGLDLFKGQAFHSARWKPAHSLAGRRVAVIGTGASAIQFVPEIAATAAHVSVFQRTPPWVVPRGDRPFSKAERFVLRFVPGAMRLLRWGIHWQNELRALGTVVNPKFMRIAKKMALRHLAAQVADPGLRRALTPDYTVGCKRILISDTWYPALSSAKVEVVPHAVERVRPDGVMTADGRFHAADTLIFGTGFQASAFFSTLAIRGAGGRDLNDAWRDGGAEAYLGAAVAGFPNMFMINGPNTGLGHNSIVFIIEANVQHVLGALKCVYGGDGSAAIEVRHDVQSRFNRWVQDRLRGSVWLTGCKSWYQDSRTGRVTTLWPGFSTQYWARARFFKRADYSVTERSRDA